MAVEEVPVNCHEIEIEIDPHRNMMRASTATHVIGITVEALSKW